MNIGLGTAAIGRPRYINVRIGPRDNPEDLEAFRAKGISVLEKAYQSGVRYFDTAPGYGMAERIIHDWQSENPYHDLEIATKWGYIYTANFDPHAEVHEVKEHSLDVLNAQWAGSKALLPRIFTLQIHSATFESGVLDNEPVLNRLQEIRDGEGVRIGLTSSGNNQNEVIKYAVDIFKAGKPLFDVFQVTYNILDQSFASLVSDLKDKRIVIKEALANGRLFRNQRYPHYQRLYDLLDRLAKKYGVGVDAIALRYCMDSISPYMVLSGASSIHHLEGNIKTANFRLTEDELIELDDHAIDPGNYWSERRELAWN